MHDLDFPLLMAASGSRSPSVIVFRLRNMRPENVLVYLRKTLASSKEALDEVRARIEMVDATVG